MSQPPVPGHHREELCSPTSAPRTTAPVLHSFTSCATLAPDPHPRLRRLPHIPYGIMNTGIHECPEERALIHRDFGSNNVLTDGIGITAVLDWDAAGCGDPLYDVGAALFWRTWLTCVDRFYERCKVRLGRLPAFAPRVLTYALAVGFAEIASSASEGDARQMEWDARRCLALLAEA